MLLLSVEQMRNQITINFIIIIISLIFFPRRWPILKRHFKRSVTRIYTCQVATTAAFLREIATEKSIFYKFKKTLIIKAKCIKWP